MARVLEHTESGIGSSERPLLQSEMIPDDELDLDSNCETAEMKVLKLVF